MLCIRNIKTNREIRFDNKDYVLNQKDYGTGKATHSTFQGINQIGEFISGSSIQGRDIAITGYILAKNPQEMQQKKRELYRLCNPTETFWAIENGYRIECISTDTVKFAVKRHENNDHVAKFIVSAICPDPCFWPLSPSIAKIGSWNGMFHFPLSIPATTGTVFGVKQPAVIINAANPGDVETGMIVEFIAKGELVHPSIFDVNTREELKINRTMAAGEVIRVNTNYGEKSVVLVNGGETVNILNDLDLESTFLQLSPGENLIRYDAQTNLSNLEVKITFYPKYLGV